MNDIDFQRANRRRRFVTTVAVLGALAIGAGPAAGQQAGAVRAAPALEHILTLEIATDPALVLGATPAGNRRIVPVTGGTFSGPGLRGTIVPGGGDWIVGRSDGVTTLDVRITLRTDDDQLIYLGYRGIIDGNPPAVPIAGGSSEVDGTYWRVAPIFETASPRYAWLNRIIAVGTGESAPGGVKYTLYALR